MASEVPEKSREVVRQATDTAYILLDRANLYLEDIPFTINTGGLNNFVRYAGGNSGFREVLERHGITDALSELLRGISEEKGE